MGIELKEHNIVPHDNVVSMFETQNMAALIQPTGTGKSYIALKIAEENPDKLVLYLSPSNAILHQVKKNVIESNGKMFNNLDRMTYQKLSSLSDEEFEKLSPDIIVLDEFHHCGSPVWGAKVKGLIENNPQAKVLGLSATPIRYFDGNVDMAEELFGGNIASEISFAEAVERDILPGFDYVSVLYGYEESIKKLENRIKNSPKSKIDEAYRLYEELTTKLDQNVLGLPEILDKHMKNKSGKYLIFCKDIEDLKKKMEEAKELFVGINPDINMYHVSFSENLKENDKALTNFENDNDPNKLKLMFSVNMLNEGYHIPDVDGVIMMRPTKSPTVFMQQMGRALTVGNSRRPTIIDLVDNFDSISVIEQSFDELRKYKKDATKDDEKEEVEVISDKVSVYDYTKNIYSIVNKITQLTQRQSLTMDEKIELFERFMEETGEKIIQNTVYEGYPIGIMLATIRSVLNNENYKNSLSITSEQIERLQSLGLLEKKTEKVEDRIDRLESFVKKYPGLWAWRKDEWNMIARISERFSDLEQMRSASGNLDEEQNEEIRCAFYERIKKDIDDNIYNNREENVKRIIWIELFGLEDLMTLEEFKSVKEELEYCKESYDYLKARISKGKLKSEDIKRLKESNVGGVFGFSNETELIMQKYGISEENMQGIIGSYGTIANFRKMYINYLTASGDENRIRHRERFDDYPLVKNFDLTSSDLIYRGNNEVCNVVIKLLEDWKVINLSGDFRNSLEIERTIEKAMEGFSEREKETLKYAYLKNKEVAQRFGISASGHAAYKNRVLRYFWRKFKSDKEIQEIWERAYVIDIENKEEFIRKFFENHDIFYNSEEFELNAEAREELLELVNGNDERTTTKIDELATYYEGKEGKIKNQAIETLEWSYEIKWVIKQCNIKTVDELINCTISDLNEFILSGVYSELVDSLEKLGCSFKKQIDNKSINELDLSTRAYKALRLASHMDLSDINVSDLIGYFNANGSFYGVKNSHLKTNEEIIEKLLELGYVMEDGKIVIPETEAEKVEREKIEREREEREEKEWLKEVEERYRLEGHPIYILDLSTRSLNGLVHADLYTVEDVVRQFNLGNLLHIKNLGRKSVEEIEEKLCIFGYVLENGELVMPEKNIEQSSENIDVEAGEQETAINTSNISTKINVDALEDEEMIDKTLEDVITKLKNAYKGLQLKKQELKELQEKAQSSHEKQKIENELNELRTVERGIQRRASDMDIDF